MKHSFKDAYGVLQKHAQTLREQTEPNIDDLLQIVEESVTAYKHCQARIDAVERALEKALENAHANEQTLDKARQPPPKKTHNKSVSKASSAADNEGNPADDIPF